MSDAIREAARALIQSVPPSFMDEANAPIGESTVAYAVDWSHLRNLRNAILAPEGKPVAPEELPYPYNFPQTNDPANAGAAPVEAKAPAKDGEVKRARLKWGEVCERVAKARADEQGAYVAMLAAEREQRGGGK